MKRYFVVMILAAVAAVSCGIDSDGVKGKFIESGMADSTWERTEAAPWPEEQTTATQKGKLIFTYNSVKIEGPIAHLSGFTRGTSLEAYTDDNKLYIKDKGSWQTPIQYTRWSSADFDKMLTLTGGSKADETFKKLPDKTN